MQMIPQLHQHVLSELDRSIRADTVFVFGAVVLDVVSIGVNSILAQSKAGNSSIIFVLFMVAVVAVSFIAAAALRNGTKGCLAFHQALMAMYEQNGVGNLYPADGIRTGINRYRLYLGLDSVVTR